MQAVQLVRPAVDIHCCRSIDEQARLLESWNQTYCQISRGAFDGSVSSVHAGAVRILVERMNRTVYQRGCVDVSRIAVGIPFQLEGHALLCGQVSHLDGLHVFSGPGGFEFLSPDKHVVVNLEIAPLELSDPLLRLAMDNVQQALGNQPGCSMPIPPGCKRSGACWRVCWIRSRPRHRRSPTRPRARLLSGR